ncbi:MAG: hypothetical protein WA980_20425 [Shinella zoogloeoides]|uniref:hypothetical protein n=1 Tax=Shinella zoogloeoides TaxID=352475 RepID=UPI003C7525D1
MKLSEALPSNVENPRVGGSNPPPGTISSLKKPQSFLTFCLRFHRRFGMIAPFSDQSSAAYNTTSFQGILTQGKTDKLGESE